MVWSMSGRTAFRGHLNIMLNNPFDSTLRKDIHPPLIPYLTAKQQPRHLHVESSDKLDRHSLLGPVQNRTRSLGKYAKESVHRISALYFFVNPISTLSHSKTYQNDGSSYYDAMKGTIWNGVITMKFKSVSVILITPLLGKLIQVLELAYLRWYCFSTAAKPTWKYCTQPQLNSSAVQPS